MAKKAPLRRHERRARRNPSFQGGLGAALIFDIMFENFQRNAPGRSGKEAAAPNRAFVAAVKEAAEFIEHGAGGLAFELADGLGQNDGRRGVQQEMDVIFLAVHFYDLAVDKSGGLAQSLKQKLSPLCGEYMTTKLDTPNDVVGQPIDTVTCCVKLRVADELAHRLDALYPLAMRDARLMLKDRSKSSSKCWKDLPCVVSKSLITKYQRNEKCKRITRIVIPICGDKGKQVKLEGAGIRVPALFKKAVLPVTFRKPIAGFVRQVEFFKRKGVWFCSVCYNTPCEPAVSTSGFVGVDRNMRGNVAVLSDPQNGKVRFFGFDASRTKHCWRSRKRRLQKQGRNRLLSKLRRKQSRRTTLENHRVSKGIVDYAASHCRSIALEDLGGVRKDGSKIKRYTETNQWSHAQLETFIRYKAALRGVSVVSVSPAYTSQTCTCCGSRHKPNGKLFQCGTCGHSNHRDVEAAFNIAHFAALRHTPVQDAAGVGSIDGPVSGKGVSLYA